MLVWQPPGLSIDHPSNLLELELERCFQPWPSEGGAGEVEGGIWKSP